MDLDNLNSVPERGNPLVVRTDFEDQERWKTVLQLVRDPVQEFGYTLYAHLDVVEDRVCRNMPIEKLLAALPRHYPYSFLFVVDDLTIRNDEFPVLVIDLRHERGRTFRALPSQVQSIENNLSIANLDFFEFADAADKDVVFRGFR